MIRLKFPAISQVTLYDQDRDNFVRNLVTVVWYVYSRPGKFSTHSFRASKEIIMDGGAVLSLIKTISKRRPTKNQYWLKRFNFNMRTKFLYKSPK